MKKNGGKNLHKVAILRGVVGPNMREFFLQKWQKCAKWVGGKNFEAKIYKVAIFGGVVGTKSRFVNFFMMGVVNFCHDPP